MNTNPSETRRNLCQRQFSDGRRCRMLRMEGHPSLCPFHVREEKQLLEADKLGAERASLSGNLNNGTDINHVLAKVIKALAEGRISARDASAFAYLGQLLLQTLSYVKNELYWVAQNPSAYHNMVRDPIPHPRNMPRRRPAAAAPVTPSLFASPSAGASPAQPASALPSSPKP